MRNQINDVPEAIISFKAILWIFAVVAFLFAARSLVKASSSFHPVIEIAEWKLGEFGIPLNMTIGEAEMYTVTEEFNDKLKGYGLTTDSTIKDLLIRMHL